MIGLIACGCSILGLLPLASALATRKSAFPVPLTVVCIGDSITSGIGSTGDNEGDSYRRDLYNLITQDGTSAEFIGTLYGSYEDAPGGTAQNATIPWNFPQPDNEGYDGYRINQILAAIESDSVLSQRPNLVLIHAGTNDNVLQWVYQDEPQPNTETCPSLPNGTFSGECIGNEHPTELYADAPKRLGSLIDVVLSADPNAVVLVAQLIQFPYNTTQWRLFNEAVPDVVNQRVIEGHKVRTVDLSSVYPYWDSVHPNNTGYQQMSQLWYSAMLDVPSSWWAAAGT